MIDYIKKLEAERKNAEKNTAMFDKNKNALYVLSAEEIEDIIMGGYLSPGEGRDRARRLATPLDDMDEYGYCEDCPGRRYRS